MVTELNSQNLNDFISSGVVLVDVYADWCSPCKMIAPIIEQLSDEYQGRVSFGKLNVDNNRDVELNVRSIPTLIIYKDGVEVNRTVGASSKINLVNTLEKFL